MQTNQEIFMLVAEELSISRAAARAYVSQQCISDHIKRMESHYGVRLFTRKPRFQLTEAGLAMLESLQKIKAIETNLQDNIMQRANGTVGRFTMGIGVSRAQIILPWVMPKYSEMFPNVEVHFLMNDTVVLEENLIKGNINLFLGVNTPYREELHFTSVGKDLLCLMISEGLLKRHFDKRERNFSEVELKDFEAVPFIKSYPTSKMNSVVQEYLDMNHIRLQFPYQLSDTATQIALCAKGLGAAISSYMLLSHITEHNKNCEPMEYIHVFPIKNFKKYLNIDIVSLGYIKKPVYIQAFEELMLQTIRSHVAELPE